MALSSSLPVSIAKERVMLSPSGKMLRGGTGNMGWNNRKCDRETPPLSQNHPPCQRSLALLGSGMGWTELGPTLHLVGSEPRGYGPYLCLASKSRWPAHSRCSPQQSSGAATRPRQGGRKHSVRKWYLCMAQHPATTPLSSTPATSECEPLGLGLG